MIYHIDITEAKNVVDTTLKHSPEAVQTDRFWEMLYGKVEPKDKQTTEFINNLELNFKK